MNKVWTMSLAALAVCAAMSTAATAQVVAGEVEPGSLQGKTLTFVSYGGVYQDGQLASLQDFVKQSGVKLLSDGPTETAKVQAQVESGNVLWDVVDLGDYEPAVHCGTLFQKLDFTKIDTSHVPPGQVGECSVPAMNYGVLFFYNKEKYKDNPPKSWADFMDVEKFPGLRGVPGYGDPEGYMIEIPLMAQGVSRADMYPADIDRGLNAWRKIRDHLILWTTGAESQQLMESGEADMVIAWSGRGKAAIENGADYAPVWQDWFVVKDQLTIPVGVKDPDAAHALINAAIGKRAQEILAEKTSYSPINTESRPQVDALTAAFMVNTPDKQKTGVVFDVNYWAQHYAELTEKWSAFLSGN